MEESDVLLPRRLEKKRKPTYWPPLLLLVSTSLFALMRRRVGKTTFLAATTAALHSRSKISITKAYYINCNASTARRDFMESWLSNYGLSYERFECIRGDTVEEVTNEIPGHSRLRLRDLRQSDFPFDGLQLAHSIACYASHYALLELISREEDGLYVLLEDDVGPAVDLASLETAAASLPSDWLYAGLNVHDSICLEDLDGQWALRRKFPQGNWQLSHVPERCTPKRMSNAWEANDYYFSDSAAFVTPQNAKAVLEHFDSTRIMPNDSVLMTQDRTAFASFVFGGDSNLFVHADQDFPEDRATPPL